MKKPELLAPAGNMEKLKMALLYGADAVYLGGKAFGLRAFGGNFSREELGEAVAFAHNLGKKVYVTVNIFPHNSDIEALPDYLGYLNSIGLDIAQFDELYGKKKIDNALKFAKDLKDRYTVLWLYYDLLVSEADV